MTSTPEPEAFVVCRKREGLRGAKKMAEDLGARGGREILISVSGLTTAGDAAFDEAALRRNRGVLNRVGKTHDHLLRLL
jgi:hypothetical protein